MSAINPVPISSRILSPLKEVSQRQWTVLAARGVLQTLVASLAVLLAISLLLGYFTEFPPLVKIVLAAIAWGSVLYAAFHCLRPALHRWSLSRSAMQAEQSIPDSHERISSAVELSQTEDQFRGSPELVAHLVKQAEEDVSRLQVAQVIPFADIFKWGLAFLPVLALWTVCALNSHTNLVVLRGLFSALTPWQSPPIVLADVSVQPGDKILAQGDSLDVVATVLPHGGKTPKAANLIQSFVTGQSVSISLSQTGGTQFSRTFENLPAQSFKYMVHTDRGDSPTYSVTVNPRPAVAQLDVRYEYPKYTGIDAKTVTHSDGNIDAVAGTQVTLTLHTTDSLALDHSRLSFNEGRPDASTLALTPTKEKNVYEAAFPVSHASDYRIKLLNEYNLGNKDDDPRAVTAEVDQPPVIAIQSPKEQITVRPDDEVLVMYIAGDDYGVAHIDAIIQVDDNPPTQIPVKFHTKDRKNIHETWTLSVPAILKAAAAPKATHISYQLQATDIRYPDPQTGLSAQQTLIINKDEQKSFQEKLNEIRKEDLEAAIRKAIDRINGDQGKLAYLRDEESRRILKDNQLKEAGELRDHVAMTGKDLSATAGEYFDTPFAEVAQAAKDIADKGIAGGADDIALMALDASTQKTSVEDGQRAYREIIKARDDLQRLLEKVEEAARKAEAAQELADAARKQAEVAREMEQHPENVDQNRQKQQDAINKLQEAMRNDPSMQNQQAQQLARDLADLQNKVEQDAQKQTDLQNQTAKQEEKMQAEKAANPLAEEQRKLNEQLQQFAKDDKKPLEQAQAKPPEKEKQDQLVKNIEKNQLQNAAQQAQSAADQLKQDAQKLMDQAKKETPNPSADQQKQQQQDQQNAQDAQNAANQANDTAGELKKQAEQQQPDADVGKQDAEKTKQAAEAIQKAADKVEQANDQGDKNADVHKQAEAAKSDAKHAAEDAQASADNQNAQDAQKQEAKAAKELAQAGQELNQAAQAEAKADQAMAQKQNKQAAAEAGDQAQELAQKQQEIAQALQQQAQQQADARDAQTPQQEGQQQQQLAQQTQQAQQAAKKLAQKAQAQKNDQLAQRADQAVQALADAEKDQQKAAQADAQGKPEDAAQAQADAQQALAKADQALRGNPEQAQADADQGQGQPEQGQGQGQPHPSAAQSAQEAAQAQQQAMQPNANAAAEAAQALAQAAQAAQQGLPGQGEEPDQEPGQEPGQHASPMPAPGSDPKMGIAGQDDGGNNKPPASVAALGINASDWAKLPPGMQKELMNASQQSGPPSYKEMIKNYYIRVARMQNEPAK